MVLSSRLESAGGAILIVLFILMCLVAAAYISVHWYQTMSDVRRLEKERDRQFQRDQDEADEVHDRTIHPEKYKE